MARYAYHCPPGVICLTPGIVTGFVVLLLVVAGAWFYSTAAREPVILSLTQAAAPAPVTVMSGDDRFARAPKPERHWITTPDLPTGAEIYGKLPRIPTRGIPETYQSMGVITLGDGKILPLYGRRTVSRSDRFQYYTRTDTYNPVQLPIRVRRRDCQDDVGCEELSNDDEVTIPSMGKGKTTIYRFDSPSYIPGLI
jgi:Family of unknown function (DUF5755)